MSYWQVGCAAVQMENKQAPATIRCETLLICYYAPSWDLQDLGPIYKLGEPCTECATGEKCQFGALCA